MKVQTKVTLLVVISSIVINLSINTRFIFNHNRELNETLGEKILNNTSLLAHILSVPLYNYDSTTVSSITDSFSIDRDLISIIIYDDNNEVVSSFSNKRAGRKIVKSGEEIYYEGQQVGRIEVEFTTYYIHKEIVGQVLNTIITTIAIAFFQLLLLVILIRNIVRPIKHLTDVTTDISRGNLNRVIDIDRDDEIGYLAKSFHTMQESVRKRTKELEDHKNNLESIVEARTRELKDTQKALVESAKMASLGNLVVGIAHEINTPLGISLTAASHLEEESLDFKKLYDKGLISKSKFDSYLKVILEGSVLIVSSLEKASLKISNFKEILVDQDNMHISQFKICEYIKSSLIKLKSIYEKKDHRVSLTYNEDFYISCDPGAILKILTILILNSIEHGFTSRHGDIFINIVRKGASFLIIYSDNGIGVEESELKHIFDPFYTTSRSNKSIGLGLSILFNLVTIYLKGEVKCTSPIGRGLEITIEIPMEVEGL